jgi:hypothetical protein
MIIQEPNLNKEDYLNFISLPVEIINTLEIKSVFVRINQLFDLIINLEKPKGELPYEVNIIYQRDQPGIIIPKSVMEDAKFLDPKFHIDPKMYILMSYNDKLGQIIAHLRNQLKNHNVSDLISSFIEEFGLSK